jgi:hypothetical protein
MNVPANMRSDPDSPFLLSMARDIVAKNPVHVVERTYNNGSYRMFADLDIPTEDPDPAFLIGLLNRAIDALTEPLRVFPIVVCTRKWRDGKVGAHLVWGDELRVNDELAIELRADWIESLESRKEDSEFWEKTIDAAVYRRNGLRMPWALKKDGHPDASYVPTHVVLDGPMEPIEPPIDVEDVHEVATWLARSSISAMEPSAGGPSASNKTKGTNGVRRTGGTGANSIRRTVATKASTEASRRLKEDTGGDDVFSLSDYHTRILMDALPKAYGITSISDIGIRCKRIGERILSIFVSARSRVCAVAEREHSANHIYFELRKDGRVFQRCHSTKCGGRGVELAGVYHGLPDDLFKAVKGIKSARPITECKDQPAAKRKKVAATSVLPSTNFDAASRASMLVSKLEELYASKK